MALIRQLVFFFVVVTSEAHLHTEDLLTWWPEYEDYLQDMEFGGCQAGYIFCLETMECVPDTEDYLPHDKTENDEECTPEPLREPVVCEINEIFCLERQQCIPIDPDDCEQISHRKYPITCPRGTIYCIETDRCVPLDCQEVHVPPVSEPKPTETQSELPPPEVQFPGPTVKTKTNPKQKQKKPTTMSALPPEVRLPEEDKDNQLEINKENKENKSELPKTTTGHTTKKTTSPFAGSTGAPAAVMVQDLGKGAQDVKEAMKPLSDFVNNVMGGLGNALGNVFG